jgi:hypothetical protein
MVEGLPKLEALSIVNCQQIHVGCVPTLLDIVHKHTEEMEKMRTHTEETEKTHTHTREMEETENDHVLFHLDVFPRFHEGPRNVLRRATYGVTYDKMDEKSVLGGVLVILLKSFLKSLRMKIATPLLAKDSLLFKWMQKVPAEDDFWAKWITYLRAYEKFFRSRKRDRKSTLCDDILAMIYNSDGRRRKSYEKKGAHFWLRQKSPCVNCEYHLPNVCFPEMPGAGESEVCIGCWLNIMLDRETDHFKKGIVETLDLLYGTQKLSEEELSHLEKTDPSGLAKRRESEFPGQKAPLGSNGMITDMSPADKLRHRGDHRSERYYPLKDNTNDLPTLDELLSPSWQKRWEEAAGGRTPRPHGNHMLLPFKAEQWFSPNDQPNKMWLPSFKVKGAKNLDFAFLQMQTIGKSFWQSNRSSLEHEQDRGPRAVLDDGKSNLKNQHSHRQTAIKLLYRMQESYNEIQQSGKLGCSRRAIDALGCMFGLAANDDRGFEFDRSTGFSKTHRLIAQFAEWHRENEIAIDGLKITNKFRTEDPGADLRYAAANQPWSTDNSYQARTPSPYSRQSPSNTNSPGSSRAFLDSSPDRGTPSKPSPSSNASSTWAYISAQDTPTRIQLRDPSSPAEFSIKVAKPKKHSRGKTGSSNGQQASNNNTGSNNHVVSNGRAQSTVQMHSSVQTQSIRYTSSSGQTASTSRWDQSPQSEYWGQPSPQPRAQVFKPTFW